MNWVASFLPCLNLLELNLWIKNGCVLNFLGFEREWSELYWVLFWGMLGFEFCAGGICLISVLLNFACFWFS